MPATADTAPLTCLADLPELAGDDEQPRSRITLFRLGRFHHARFGKWNISREVFDSFLSNFQAQGRVPIDVDHAPEKQGGSTEAAGWIVGLEVVGDEMKADVEWTRIGADAIREKRYAYISPTWSFDARDPHGNKIGPKLIGAGLTNRPHFSDLPMLSLSASAEALAFADEFGLRVEEGADAWARADDLADRLEAGELSYADAALAEADALVYAADEPSERPAVSEARQRERLAERALALADEGKMAPDELERFASDLCYVHPRDRLAALG